MLDKNTATDSMTLTSSFAEGRDNSEPELYTPESHPETKKTTSLIRLNICEKDTPATNSSKISVVGSISKEKDSTPYWSESCLVESKKLLSLTETGYAGSDLISSEILQVNTTQKSWFSTIHSSHLKKNLSETLFPSSTFSPVGFTDSENTIARSRKIRIYPQNKDIRQFKKYLGLTRYWFNQAVDYLKQKGTKAILNEVRKIQKLAHRRREQESFFE